jgi:hypothetical protein
MSPGSCRATGVGLLASPHQQKPLGGQRTGGQGPPAPRMQQERLIGSRL